MKLTLLKILRTLNIIDKETYNKKRSIILVEKSSLFDKNYYVLQFPDVDFSKVSPAEHYVYEGWKKSINPSKEFVTEKYLKDNPKARNSGIVPLVHYELYGKKRKGCSEKKIQMPFLKNLLFVIQRRLGKIRYKEQIKKNKNARILVCLHLFYMEEWQLIKKYLKNLSDYKYDLFVTYIKDHYDEKVLDDIKDFKSSASFREYSNQGFDIGPFADVLQEINLNDYDILFKIHSKGVGRSRIFIYHQVFRFNDWFFNLYDAILGPISVHKLIDLLLHKDNVSLVAAENLIVEDPKHKKFFTQRWAEKLGVKIDQNYHFVAGSCFACKAGALINFKKLKLKIDDFESTCRGEFSFAHAVERIVCAMIEAEKGQFYGIETPHKKYLKQVKKYEKSSSLRLLDDDRFTLDYDFFYKVLEGRRVFDYQLQKVRIKDIRRKWVDGNIYNIKDTSVYAYLQGDAARYDSYCKTNSDFSLFSMNKNKFDSLISSMNEGFDDKMVPVLDARQNIIEDGQHRLAILLDRYGEDYEVMCLKLFHRKPTVLDMLKNKFRNL